MADNKRFVSYMYEYKNDEKLNNVGYARVESRGSQCKVFIHMDLAGMEGKLYKAYLFYRRPGKSRFAYLGNILFTANTGELKVKSDRDNIMNSNLQFEDFGGILIYENEDFFVACEWDEVPITKKLIHQIETLEMIDTRSIIEVEQVREQVEVEPKPAGPIQVVNYKGEAVEILPEIPEEKKDTVRQEASAALEDSVYQNRDYYRNRTITQVQPGYRNISYEQPEDKENLQAADLGSGGELSCIEPTFGKTEYEILPEESLGNKSSGEACFTCHPIAQNIFRRFPKVYPFEDNEIVDCVRMEPQDIGLLPIEAWVLGNNSFLLHGYYTYRHLIFGKMKVTDGFIYVLGVPGVYHNRESFMARMFGFEYFKQAKLGEEKNGEFGYYYIPIQLG